MIKVRIGSIEKDVQDVRESWINEQLHRRRREDESVCVQVTVNKSPLNMVLSTPSCSGTGGGRAPNAREQRIFELWDKHKLNRSDFTGDNLIAFLKQVS
jgi:hypothetical protein